MASSTKQLRCTDYHVAWICPVADVELLPARLMLDEEHSIPPYDTHYDENTYVCGEINGHAVVFATCPPGETGNVNAGRLTGSMFKTFPNIRMAVLVGIGGGIPRPIPSEDPLDDIHLGDVVVGWPGDGKPACVYHDRGRSKVGSQTEMLGTMQNPDWRLINALGVLSSDHELGRTKFDQQLTRLRGRKKFAYPGRERDRLFKATHHHVGSYGSHCMHCGTDELVRRPQRDEDDEHKLIFHCGRIATGTSVIQDGELRDRIRERCDGALCVEMEAAGVDVNRQCLVIRGISDYADSHKNDVWKSYAAGNAAAFTRELLCRIRPDVIRAMEGVKKAFWRVPLPKPHSFVGRADQLSRIIKHISKGNWPKLAIYGLGGCGKTALALELAHKIREQEPARSVFWVPAFSRESFEQAYQEIGKLLRIPGVEDIKSNVDIKQLVKDKLSNEDDVGQWLIIVDNADDVSILLEPLEDGSGANRLIDYLPQSRRNSIVFTTRTRKAAVQLAENRIELGKLTASEAKDVLKTRLQPQHLYQLDHTETVDEFLAMLYYFALAIVQAVAFMNRNDIPLSEYIALYRISERDTIDLLSEEFEEPGRYRETRKPVATTWNISFAQIRRDDKLAADYLSFMACVASDDIPASMLPSSHSIIKHKKAIGTLKAYAFVTERKHPEKERPDQTQRSTSFDVHPLVHLAMRRWLKEQGQRKIWAKKVLTRLNELIPDTDVLHTREIWTQYLPHATYVANLYEGYISHALRRAQKRTFKSILRLRRPHDITSKQSSTSELWVTLWRSIASCEFDLGRYSAAERAYQKVHQWHEKVLGREHPDTILSLNSVAASLTQQDKFIEAEKMQQEALELINKVLGKEHQSTLMSMNNFAALLAKQGKVKEAEKLRQKTFKLREKVLGKEHIDTLQSMRNLAVSSAHQKKYAEAKQILQDTVALQKKVLGKEHPDTLDSMLLSAYILNNQKEYAEAERILRETLALQKKVVGEKHPYTLHSMFELAMSLEGLERYAEAISLMEEGVQLGKEVLGLQHPYTQRSLEMLNEWRDKVHS